MEEKEESSEESEEEEWNKVKRRRVDDGTEVQAMVMDSRKKVFFTQPGCKLYDCFFELCKECTKSGEKYWLMFDIL